MVCSNCQQEGHTKTKCKNPHVPKMPKESERKEMLKPILLAAEVREKLMKLMKICIEVANGLGKGHVEAHYQQAMSVELQELGVRHVLEEVMPILYKGIPLGGTCNARLDIMLHSFLPFIFELKAVSKCIQPEHYWQLVRYMGYKDITYGAVVNFNQSVKYGLEVRFVVKHEGSYWLYDLDKQTGKPMVDFSMTRFGAPMNDNVSDSDDSTVDEDWEWPEHS